MRFLLNRSVALFAAFFCMFITAANAKPIPTSVSTNTVSNGFSEAQACEPEIDDDLTFYGECIGHAADRMSRQQLSLLGLHFQAWLIADLAARQGSTSSQHLRQRYFQSLSRSLRKTGWNVKQLCTAKQLECETVKLRLQQKL